MKCSKEMAEKVAKYEKLQKQADELYKEIEKYFEEELGAEGFEVPFITNKPIGDKVNDDEYCDQHCIYEGWYQGTYYYKIDGSKKWVGYSFNI